MLQCGYEVEKQSHVLLELIKNRSANFKGIIRDGLKVIGEGFYAVVGSFFTVMMWTNARTIGTCR